MALVKSYLLAPNFTFKPDGPIALGNILANPFRPHRVLDALDPDKLDPSQIETFLDHDYSLERGKRRGGKLSVWAQFLLIASAKITAERNVESRMQCTMTCLETRYFKTVPSEEEIAARLNNPRIQAAIKSGALGFGSFKPLYIITGLKIAKSLSISSGRDRRHAGGVELGAPVTPDISVGAGVEGFSENTETDEFKSGGDVVFAYEVMKISLKRRGNVEVKDYVTKAAYLGQGDGDERRKEDPLVVEGLDVASTADITSADDGAAVTMYETDNGEMCISFSG